MTNPTNPINEDLSDRLRGLAQRISGTNPATSGRLSRLAQDVSIGDADKWIHVNIPSVIDIEGLGAAHLGDTRQQRRRVELANLVADIVESLRNVFILLPLIVTWAAIAEAVSNYQILLARVPDTKFDSFLGLWQNRFNGVGGNTLEAVANADVMLLLVVVVLTIVALILTNWARTASNQASNRLRADLSNAVADLSIWLGERQTAGDTSMPNRYKDVAEQLLENVKLEFDGMSNLAQKNRDLFDQMMRQMSQAFAQEIAGLQKAAAENRVASSQIADFGKHLDKGSAGMETSAVLLKSVADSLGTTATGLNERTGQLQQTQAQLTKNLADVGITLKSLSTTQQESLGKQETVMANLATNMEGIGSQLKEAITSIASAGARMERIASAVMTLENQLLESTAKKDVEQNRAVASLGQVADQLHQVLTPVTAFGRNLLGVSGELTQILRSLESLPAQLQKPIVTMAQGQTAAATSLTKASAKLDSASATMDEASKRILTGLQRLMSDARASSANGPQ